MMADEFWTKVPLRAGTADELAEHRGHLGLIEAPPAAIWLASVMKTITHDYGYLASLEKNEPVWGNGEPIPMYTYSLVEYLMGLDFSAIDVAEFGAGASTLFWAKRARSVVAFENDRKWLDRLVADAPANVDFIFSSDMPGDFLALGRKFGLIVVDCRGNRYDCAAAATQRLAAGGMIILDNSEWYPNSARLLRDADLIQVDFPGLRPGRFHACATSIFLARDFTAKPAGAQMPLAPAGGKPRPPGKWDFPAVKS
jgi:hypothetical protein